MNCKLWTVNDRFDHTLYSDLVGSGIGALTAKILSSRQNIGPDKIYDFLNPRIDKLHDPFLFNDMKKAVNKILQTGFEGKKILIYGDYDVDGVTGSSMLYNFLRSLHFNVSCYIPDRLEEGYGFSSLSTENVIGLNPDLTVTVDCGITSKEYIKLLTDHNITVIVTDHHEPMSDKVPECYALLAATMPDSGYPFRNLCGAGVVFKLISAMCRMLDENKGEYPFDNKENIKDRYLEYLDLAALGTVSDVVPLVDENRIIVKFGLEQIRKTRNTGLKELLRVSDLENRTVDTYHVGFVLGPRLNAAGRIGSAYRALELLTSTDEEKCREIAEELNTENIKRQMLQDTIFKEADLLIKKQNDLDNDKVLVVAKEGWHHGVIGIVSSKITEKYSLPSILLAIEEDNAKGSGRSIKNFNLFQALYHADRFLERYGGHEAAAGMTLKRDHIDALREALNEYAKNTACLEDLIPTLYADTKVSLEDVTKENITDMESLKPFGEGNKQPVFVLENLEIVQLRAVGQNKNHLSLRVKQRNVYVDAIGYNMGEFYEYLEPGETVHVMCSMGINEWNGRSDPSLRLIDIKLTDERKIKELFYNHFTRHIEFERFKGYNSIKELEDKLQSAYLTVANKKLQDGELISLIEDITNINRQTLIPVFKYVKYKKPVMVNCRCTSLSEELYRLTGVSVNPIKLLICMKILYDTGVITAKIEGDCIRLEENRDQTQKVELEHSRIYRVMNKLYGSMNTA